MNEFLQQFVVESRELASQAVDGLLELEQAPKDAERLDAVFRAFHTLKGGAGIVEFPAMERAVHAAEEVLGEARSGHRTITPALVSGCIEILDKIGQWLESIASSGVLPQADADADAIVRRLAGLDSDDAVLASGAIASNEWIGSLLSRLRPHETPVTAIRYTPSVDCFFQGEDPAARIASIPQLLAHELSPVSAWPSLSQLDPYACNLILMALSAGSADSVSAHMQGYIGDCEIVDVRDLKSNPERAGASGDLVRQLLEAQLALLAEAPAEQFLGRVASAGQVAGNALLSTSREDQSRKVIEATEQSLREKSVGPLMRVLQSLLSTATTERAAEAMPGARAADATLRVDTTRIDALVRLTGELTTAKNALAHTVSLAQEAPISLKSALRDRLKELETLVARLQHSVLALRVLPLKTVLQRFPRVLREISSSLGKPAVLHIEGDHTEADKAIVDVLFEPLLHALRNAIDHGVESPARRMEIGKPLVASIRIRARRESDRVIVEVEDDGGGVDVGRVREVALKRHLVTPEALEVLSEPEIVDLIFAPGFSTAATVTEISGRGVGLDAVRTAIARIGGQVSLLSRSGMGTTLKFSLPFSVMVTQVLTVEAGGQSFGIPLDSLLETLKVPRDRILGVAAAQVIVHRDRTLPLFDLASELGKGPVNGRMELPEVTVALASVADGIIALRVDRVGERIDVILKPLEGLLVGLRGIAGTTLLGDGRVLLVLDVRGLLT